MLICPDGNLTQGRECRDNQPAIGRENPNPYFGQILKIFALQISPQGPNPPLHLGHLQFVVRLGSSKTDGYSLESVRRSFHRPSSARTVQSIPCRSPYLHNARGSDKAGSCAEPDTSSIAGIGN